VPIVVVGIIAFAALFGGAVIASRPKAQSGWFAVTGGALPLGQRYRWSATRAATADAQVIANALEAIGLDGTLVWPGDTYPDDWASDDRNAGRMRVEGTLSGALAPSIGSFLQLNSADVRVWQLRRT
jgi:hypothetical protein